MSIQHAFLAVLHGNISWMLIKCKGLCENHIFSDHALGLMIEEDSILEIFIKNIEKKEFNQIITRKMYN